MDHTQSREFHHHLARAIMHLNCLAGFLPFFEPAIEWDDPMGDPHTRAGRSNPAQRSLHTFVPLPSSSSASTMASHGGIPTHMILNPEPNLRPLSIASRPRNDEIHPATLSTLRPSHPETRHPSPPAPHSTAPDPLRVTSRKSTASVPVRSKQRSNNPEDPQPKKKQRWGDPSIHQPPVPPIPLPTITEVPPDGLNSEDSNEEEVVLIAHPAHDLSTATTNPAIITSTGPTDRSTSPTSRTANPKSLPKGPPSNPTIRILQPAESDRYTPHSTIRPWTDYEDQEWINFKNDSKSRPSWKSIGAKFRRDPQVCKLRWNLLKQLSNQNGTETPRKNEPEAED